MSKSLGLFGCGRHKIIVIVDTDHGNGSFDVEHGTMTVGLDHELWSHCLNVLLHETLEFLLSVNECRLTPDIAFSGGNDLFIFLMTHPKFSEICGQAADFLATVTPLIGKEYEYHKKGKRKKG